MCPSFALGGFVARASEGRPFVALGGFVARALEGRAFVALGGLVRRGSEGGPGIRAATSDVRGPTSDARSPGDWIVTGSSSSLKIRSDEAIAACRMLNFSDMSEIGRKKRCEYSRNATSDPSVSVWLSTHP